MGGATVVDDKYEVNIGRKNWDKSRGVGGEGRRAYDSRVAKAVGDKVPMRDVMLDEDSGCV
jgi:hypothetical protein